MNSNVLLLVWVLHYGVNTLALIAYQLDIIRTHHKMYVLKAC